MTFESWKDYRVIKRGARLGKRNPGSGNNRVDLKIGDVIRCLGMKGNGAWNPSSLAFSFNGAGSYHFSPGSYFYVPEKGYLEPVED